MPDATRCWVQRAFFWARDALMGKWKICPSVSGIGLKGWISLQRTIDNWSWGGSQVEFWEGGEGGRHERTLCNERQPSTHPQPCEPLLAGWIMGANGHVTTPWHDNGEERGERGGLEHEQTPCNEQKPSTHPQPCEPLLTGWIMGANGHITTHLKRTA
jgi:hypothetical protein